MEQADDHESDGKRLKKKFDELKTETGMSKAEFARVFSVPGGASMISQHISGHRPIGLDAMVAYAKGFNCAIEEISPTLAASLPTPFYTGSKNLPLAPVHQAPAAINLVNNPDFPAVRRVRFKLSAGASGFAVDYVDDDMAPIVFQRQWFDRHGYTPSELLATKVANDSMEPGLYHGDTVIINTGDTNIVDGEVFAMNYEGELVIKRMVRDASQWWLASDNPDQRRYPRKVCNEDVFCLGKIVLKQSERI